MSFRNELAQETVDRLPLRNAIAVGEHTVVRAAIALMRSNSLGCAVIVDHNVCPIGGFTEQSVIQMLCDGASLDTTPVSDYADPLFKVAQAGDSIQSVWDAVVVDGARFVCVTDANNRLKGLTGQRGLAEYVADCFAKQLTVQRLGSNPWMLQREGA